jgi:hypothetical protein
MFDVNVPCSEGTAWPRGDERRNPVTALPTISASAIGVAPIRYVDRTLDNGLRAILVPDPRVPSVAINVAYRVGGKDDPPGRSGFAHLFEHLMFKGTSRTVAETMDRLTEDVGGYNNAFTSEDITNYYEVVPSNHLERLLWAEADRLASLTVNQANFVTERDVVIGEYDQRILAEPYGMLDELVNREAYAVHPYRRGVIGSPAELNAASLDDVVAFHATYYRPDNALLVVAGDLDVDQTLRWIERWFGPIPTPSASSNRRRRSSADTSTAPRTSRCRRRKKRITSRRRRTRMRRRSTCWRPSSVRGAARGSTPRWSIRSKLRRAHTPPPICASTRGCSAYASRARAASSSRRRARRSPKSSTAPAPSRPANTSWRACGRRSRPASCARAKRTAAWRSSSFARRPSAAIPRSPTAIWRGISP